MSDPPILKATGLEKTYPDGQVHALRGIDLSVGEGEFLAITGPSGCGKSTLLHILGGLDRPDRGEVTFRGKPLSEMDLDRFRAREVGFIFQSFHLVPTLSAIENVQMPMFEGPWPQPEREKRASDLLDDVGLPNGKTRRSSRLSVGERQRVAIARALANEPSLLLADEPTGNLDTRNQDEVIRLLKRLREGRKLSIVVVTHGSEVADAADRVFRMRDGRADDSTK